VGTDIVVPDYGGASLACACTFDALCWASRAFSSWTYLVKISSALSIGWSSSTGSTVMVTDLVRAALLEDGLPSVSRGNVCIFVPIS
jgi:hypothetical protein